MSYDLFFRMPEQVAAPNIESLQSYFKERKNYEVSDKQAFYQNETTGVYFIFDFEAPEDEDLSGVAPISFNLNYFRPHIFGLEAEPELKALVESFGFLVVDPQMEGMGEGQYSTEGFLAGWNQGNEFGYRSFLKEEPSEPVLTLPTSQIEACWRWNFAREELQQQLGEDIFVPRFMFLERQGRVVRSTLWPDGIPTAVPEADILMIPRKTILPKKFFRHPEDMVIAMWEEVKPILDAFPVKAGAVSYHSLEYATPPEAVLSFLRALQPTTEQVQALPTDKVLNEELVAKARTK